MSQRKMRGATVGMLALLAFALGGCGGGQHFADKPSPPTPVNLTVYISNSKILVSPSSVGAGPVMFVITNQASHAVALSVRPAAGGAALASTAPINPQATSSFAVTFRPGDYTLETTAADTLASGTIAPASLRIGSERPNGNNALLEP